MLDTFVLGQPIRDQHENPPKHLKAEEKPLRLKQWDEMTDEDKLDRSIEQSMINKELQKWQDQEKLNVSYCIKSNAT